MLPPHLLLEGEDGVSGLTQRPVGIHVLRTSPSDNHPRRLVPRIIVRRGDGGFGFLKPRNEQREVIDSS
jgi:hypothetical protein